MHIDSAERVQHWLYALQNAYIITSQQHVVHRYDDTSAKNRKIMVFRQSCKPLSHLQSIPIAMQVMAGLMKNKKIVKAAREISANQQLHVFMARSIVNILSSYSKKRVNTNRN